MDRAKDLSRKVISLDRAKDLSRKVISLDRAKDLSRKVIHRLSQTKYVISTKTPRIIPNA